MPLFGVNKKALTRLLCCCFLKLLKGKCSLVKHHSAEDQKEIRMPLSDTAASETLPGEKSDQN